MKKMVIACCGLAIVAIVGPVTAKDVNAYAIKEIEYKNKGAYSANIEVRFKIKNDAGKTVTCKMTGSKLTEYGSNRYVGAGQSMTYDLGDGTFFNIIDDNPRACKKLNNNDAYGTGIPKGSEVRAHIRILAGEKENCHKENRARFYYHPKGGTVTYMTRGTTLINNRCQLQSKGGVLLEDVQ